MEVLQKIDLLKKELDALRPLDKAAEQRIMQKFRLDWNYHSSKIEGNSLTYGETKALILFNITAQGKPLKDHIEMTGHNEAVKWIEDIVKSERPLTENFIRQLNELVLKEPYEVNAITADGQPTKKRIIPGQYKTLPNHVRTSTGEIFYFANPEETPAKMMDLVSWYRIEDEKAEKHPLILAAKFHYDFIHIHPFDDGNGRTARILMNFILMKHGFAPVIIKTEDKEAYYSVLRQADAGIIQPFFEYIAQNLVHSLDLMVRGAKGESIEDPDDIDKELALLEMELKEQEEEIKVFKSSGSIFWVFNDSITPLFEKLGTEFLIFKNFYAQTTYEIWIDDQPVLKSELTIPNVYTMMEIITDLTTSIVIELAFSNFRYKGYENLSYKENIVFLFKNHTYETQYLLDKKPLIKKYNKKLSGKEIKDIIDFEKWKHFSFIKEKIEKKKNLPF